MIKRWSKRNGFETGKSVCLNRVVVVVVLIRLGVKWRLKND
jgi:hypothetical protein